MLSHIYILQEIEDALYTEGSDTAAQTVQKKNLCYKCTKAVQWSIPQLGIFLQKNAKQKVYRHKFPCSLHCITFSLTKNKVHIAIPINGTLYQYAKITNSFRLLPFKAGRTTRHTVGHLHIRHTTTLNLSLNRSPFTSLWVMFFLSFKVLYIFKSCFSSVLQFYEVL